ncbi:unnamed protein product [Rotaria sp. Silwood2]|nr:unnamed protein product [Rotaria sp. Silwood2]
MSKKIFRLQFDSFKNISHEFLSTMKTSFSMKPMFISTPCFCFITVPLRASITDIHSNATWSKNGITVAGGNEAGSEINRLSEPLGLYVDDGQTIYVADWLNNRIVEWKFGATNGTVVAGGNETHQLISPHEVIIDRENDSLIVSDPENTRVVRCSLYVVDCGKHEVRRYKIGDTTGTVVAGGNGKGGRLDQFSLPRYVFVDRDHSVYASDVKNHRIMKWEECATQGIVVAGGQGKENSLTQLNEPEGVVVDQLDTVYVADHENHRIMRWRK